MATHRKRWFKVADSVAVEPWSNDQLATFIRLCAYLNTRWARDGLRGGDAGRAQLSRANVMAISGKRRLDVAQTLLSSLADVASMSVEHQANVTLIEWRKYPIFQGYESQLGAELETVTPLAVPPPTPAPAPRRVSEEDKSMIPPAARTEKPKPQKPSKSHVPDDLEPEQKVALLAWVRAKHPAEEPRIREHVDACLDHHRKNGNRACIVDWIAACRTWIRNADRFRPVNGARAKQEERAQLLAENVQAAMRLAEERERREREAASADRADAHVRRLRAVADAEQA